MNAYGIIRIEKVKSSAIGAMQFHNDRLPGNHANPDINPERTHLNKEYVEHGKYREEIEARITENYRGKRAVRSDAIKLIEGVVTASPEWFENKTSEEIEKFFSDTFQFVQKTFGANNLLHFTVHYDESTPHAHFGFVPLTSDGRLSAKEIYGGRSDLSKLQDNFYESICASRGMARGEKDTGRTHKSLTQLKTETAKEIKKLEEQKQHITSQVREANTQYTRAVGDVSKIRRQKNQVQEELNQLTYEKESVESDIDEANDRLEYLRRTGDEKEAAVSRLNQLIEKLGTIIRNFSVLDTAGRSQRSTILRDITRQCTQLLRELTQLTRTPRETIREEKENHSQQSLGDMLSDLRGASRRLEQDRGYSLGDFTKDR